MLHRRRSFSPLLCLAVVAGVTPFAALAACSSSDSGSSSGDPMPSTTMTTTATTSAKPTATPTMTTTAPPGAYQNFDINHVLSAGQSNSVGNGATVTLETTQPYKNIMFSSGVITATGCLDGDGCTGYEKPTSFVPLVEGDKFFDYPVETMSSPMANLITSLARGPYMTKIKQADHVVLVSVHGRSGNTYWSLRKGGSDYQAGRGYVFAFDDGMMQVDDAMALAKAAGKTYVVRAVTAIHGESDNTSYDPGNMPEVPIPGTDGASTITNYYDGLVEWQRDYETAIKAKTGQTIPVPLLISQIHNWMVAPHSKVVEWQYDAHVKSKGKIQLVGPSYMLTFAADCLHYTSESERWIGEYYAKAYARIVFDGLPWEPIRPASVKIAGNVVTAKFMVPKPPLVFDTTQVTDPGNKGFEFVDAAQANVAITNVALTAPDTVTITLATAPAAGGHLRYAFTAVPAACPGPLTGPRGNLRDSDTTTSLYGNNLANWAVTFDEPAL